jgi:hypothetical protein
MAPVLVLNDKPDGNGEFIAHEVAAAPEFVGVTEVIAVPTEALIVDGE